MNLGLDVPRFPLNVGTCEKRFMLFYLGIYESRPRSNLVLNPGFLRAQAPVKI
jgi:hypothetical protein